MRRAAAIVLCAALAAGCATRGGVSRVPDSDPRVADAMAYARGLLRRTEPVPVEWYTMRGKWQAPDGMWCMRAVQLDGIWTGAQTEYLPGRTRVVVYVGPHGEQLPLVWRHEAVHAVGRGIIVGDHPERTTTGVRLRGVVPYW